MNVKIYKAQTGVAETPSVKIDIETEIPTRETLEKQNDLFEDEAIKLCNVLEEVLPGGTFDRLFCEMMKRKASSFIVSYKK